MSDLARIFSSQDLSSTGQDIWSRHEAAMIAMRDFESEEPIRGDTDYDRVLRGIEDLRTARRDLRDVLLKEQSDRLPDTVRRKTALERVLIVGDLVAGASFEIMAAASAKLRGFETTQLAQAKLLINASAADFRNDLQEAFHQVQGAISKRSLNPDRVRPGEGYPRKSWEVHHEIEVARDLLLVWAGRTGSAQDALKMVARRFDIPEILPGTENDVDVPTL